LITTVGQAARTSFSVQEAAQIDRPEAFGLTSSRNLIGFSGNAPLDRGSVGDLQYVDGQGGGNFATVIAVRSMKWWWAAVAS